MNLQNKINRIPSRFEAQTETPDHPLKHMFGKPVLSRDAKTVLTLNAEKFAHKLLCTGITLNPGDACAFGCTYCYVGPQMLKVVKPTLVKAEAELGRSLNSEEVVIRRARSKKLLRSQLFKSNGDRKFTDPTDTRTVFCSTTVDPAATIELLHETAELCNCILENTYWHIRLLSKSALLAKLVTNNLIDPRHHHRLIFGFSIGTLDDGIARAIEVHASSPKARLKALHELQDRGIRTFGMICPSLPQRDYAGFSAKICAAMRVERCEHVWAEVLNVRGRSLTRTAGALRDAGYHEEAAQLEAVSGADHSAAWEQYARDTFLAHARNIPKSKLRFLQYIDKDTASWWETRRSKGAVLIGKAAEELGLVTTSS